MTTAETDETETADYSRAVSGVDSRDRDRDSRLQYSRAVAAGGSGSGVDSRETETDETDDGDRYGQEGSLLIRILVRNSIM